MSDPNNALNTANGREFERKDRPASDSDSGNVVDHYAPHGESSFLNERGEYHRRRSWILICISA